MTSPTTGQGADLLDDAIVSAFEARLEKHGEAAASHLSEGRAIHYVEADTAEGHVIREHPNGVRELLRIDTDGGVHVVCALPR